MARSKKPWRLFQRNNGSFYWWPSYAKGWQSTGCKNRTEAENWCAEHYNPAAPTRVRSTRRSNPTLREYLKPYYVEGSCHHIQRLRTEHKNIGAYHIHQCRQLIVNKIFPDPIADLKVRDLRRADILDFRNRLAQNNGPSVVNRTITVLKTCIQEGIYREELQRNPCSGVGNIQYKQNTSGTFTAEEITTLFGECPGPWSDESVYTYFLLLFSCGLRRGEGLALQWGDIDFDNNVLSIRRTLQNNGEPKLPKWEKVGEAPLPEFTAKALKRHRATMERILPTDWVFTNVLGEVRRHHWAAWQFEKTTTALGIDTKGRSLRIHSLRHSAHSHLLAKGYSPELARASFGWGDLATQRGYMHFNGKDLSEQGRIIDGMFGKPSDANG